MIRRIVRVLAVAAVNTAAKVGNRLLGTPVPDQAHVHPVLYGPRLADASLDWHEWEAECADVPVPDQFRGQA